MSLVGVPLDPVRDSAPQYGTNFWSRSVGYGTTGRPH